MRGWWPFRIPTFRLVPHRTYFTMSSSWEEESPKKGFFLPTDFKQIWPKNHSHLPSFVILTLGFRTVCNISISGFPCQTLTPRTLFLIFYQDQAKPKNSNNVFFLIIGELPGIWNWRSSLKWMSQKYKDIYFFLSYKKVYFLVKSCLALKWEWQ